MPRLPQRSRFLLCLCLVPTLRCHGFKPFRLSNSKGAAAASDVYSHHRRRSASLVVSSVPLPGDGECEPSRPSRRGMLSRRRMFQFSNLLSISLIVGSGAARASGDDPQGVVDPVSARQPFAPTVSNLVPATRVRLWIQQLVELASRASAATDGTARRETLVQIRGLLVESPPPFLSVASPDEAKAMEQYLATPTLDAWNRARQQEVDATTRFQTSTNPSSFLTTNPLWAMNEGVEQWGERRQFRRLQSEQRQLEKSNAIRAAFNAYTNNLLYGDSVRITAAPDVRKKLIREDRLPDVSSVIRSDLDLRDLYRNQVLSAIDDAKAELEYQLNIAEDDVSVDATDLLSLLRTSQASCDQWFALVPAQDAQDALRMASTSIESK